VKDFAEGTSISSAETYLQSIEGAGNSEFMLGANTSRIYFEDPKLLLFTMSRYKFVSKMLSGFNRVLEIGCQEAFGSTIVAKEVGTLHCIDFYQPHIDSCVSRFKKESTNMSFQCKDIITDQELKGFDAVYALDVLEHIEKKDEDKFMQNSLNAMTTNSLMILGMPSIESQRYASDRSRIGHVNCKSGSELKEFAGRFLLNAQVFCMNDEVLHTGFYPMAQYLFAVGIKK